MRAVQHPSHHREQLNVLHTTARTVRDTGAVATWASDDRARGLGYRIGRLVDRELLGQLTTAPAIRLWGAAAASRSAAVELQDVVGAADELALGGCCHSASCHEVADVASTLDLSEDGFDDLLVLPVERAPRLGRDLAVHLRRDLERASSALSLPTPRMRTMTPRSTCHRSAASITVTSWSTSCRKISYFCSGVDNRLARRPSPSAPRDSSVIGRSSSTRRGDPRMLLDPWADPYREVMRKPGGHFP